MEAEDLIKYGLIPEFVGTNSQNTKTYYWGKNAFKDNSETVEIVCFFMALIGFFFYRKKESYFLGGLALLALIYALGAGTPFFKIFFYIIPMVKSMRAARRPSQGCPGPGLAAFHDALGMLIDKFHDVFRVNLPFNVIR